MNLQKVNGYWYSIQVESGCEKQVKRSILSRKSVLGDTHILEVEVPEKSSMLIDKSGRRKKIRNILLPGYVLLYILSENIEEEDGMITEVFPAISHDIIRSTSHVLGFTGHDKGKPRKLSQKEVNNIFSLVDETFTEVKQNILSDYYPGDVVEVIQGPFTGARVEIISTQGNKLVTSIDICGRITTAEFTRDQIYKK